MSVAVFLPCGRPAVAIVDNGDEHPYWMCDQCARHNVHNRQAQAWVPAELALQVLNGINDLQFDPRIVHRGYAELEDLLKLVT